jgi:hypothetical protein
LGLGLGLGLGLEPESGAHALVQIRDAAAGRQRMGGARAWGRTQAVSASTTRATRLARSRQCALRSGAQQGQLDLTACDRHETRRVGRAVWGCRAGRSRVVEVLRQRRARAAQAAHVPRAAAPPEALWHGSVATDRRPARRPPSVKYASHRNGAAASPPDARTARREPHTGAPAREGVLLVCFTRGGEHGDETRRCRALLPRPRRAGRARAGAPPGSTRASRPARTTRRTSWGSCGT